MSAVSDRPERLVTTTPSVDRQDGQDGVVLSLAGEWIVAAGHQLEAAGASLISLAKDAKSVIFDFAGLQRMDTAGAWFIDRAEVELAAAGATVAYRGEQPKHDILLKEAGYHAPEKSTRIPPPHTVALLSAVGETVYGSGVDFFDIVDYLGEIVVMFLRLAPQPWRWRWTPMIHHLEMYGLRSVPIILLINFLVGAIVTQQGIFQLNSFGASSYAVNLVGVLGLRELGVLMTSIMIAGRTGSSITAEIGSMKMREEIDALKVMALDPLEVLIALPILTFLADLAEIAGGVLVGWLYAGLTPAAFLLRLQNAVLPETFLVGLIKAPFMALVIGLIAATEGMEVGGSAESLGRCVTSSVVKSIFMVIVMDGLFAMFFATVNY
jgi:phospholipid/cholesterol/gamma-HCH transport system permease protein